MWRLQYTSCNGGFTHCHDLISQTFDHMPAIMAQEATAVYKPCTRWYRRRSQKTLSFFHKLLIFKTSSSVYLYVSVLGLELHWNIIKMVKTNTIRHLCLQPSCGAAAQSLQKSRGAWPADTAQDVMWKTSRDTATARNDSCSIQSGTDAVFGWFFQASFPVIYKTHIVCFSIRLRQKFKENMQLNMSLLWLGRGLVKC